MAEKQFSYDLRKPCIAIWPSLIEPKAYKNPKTGVEGVAKYGAHFSFPEMNPDIKAIKEMAVDAFRSEYEDIPLADVKWPWATGVQVADKRAKKAGAPGSTTKSAEFFREFAFVLVAKSKYIRLGIWKDGRTTELQTPTQRMAAEDRFYSGAKVVAEFGFKPYFNDTNEQYGVTAYANQVALYDVGVPGKRIGGKDMNETFKNVVGHETTDDPTGEDDYVDF